MKDKKSSGNWFKVVMLVGIGIVILLQLIQINYLQVLSDGLNTRYEAINKSYQDVANSVNKGNKAISDLLTIVSR